MLLVLVEMLKRELVSISYCPEAPVGAGVVRCWSKYSCVAGVVEAASQAGVDPLVVPWLGNLQDGVVAREPGWVYTRGAAVVGAPVSSVSWLPSEEGK